MPAAAEHERAGIGRIGQQRVHRAIGRPGPPHAPRADRAARQPLTLVASSRDDLPRGAEPPPELEHALDRVADLLVSGEHDPPVLVAIQTDREVQLKLAALGLVAQPAVQPGADQVQLGLRHRALQPEQQPVVEIARRVDPVRVGDQRAGQRAQIQQLMPVRRGAREPRGLKRQDQPDMPQPDLGDQLLEPQPPVGRRARSGRDPHRPRSPIAAGQPSSIARCRSAYCRARDSWLRSNCVGVDAEVRRRRGALAGPFPTPPSRTRRDRFRSPGSPVTMS